jgi:ElaB/YqjD/DUF883 family membrane-anchored ribosome-binding protein
MTEHEQKTTARSALEDKDPDIVRLQEGIEQTRGDMSATITALETRLSPAEVREKVGSELKHVEERVRVVVREQLGEAKELVQAELAEAKSLLRTEMNEAEEKIKRGLGEARDALKQDAKEAISGAKQAVRAATLGRVEDLATNIGDKMNEARDTLVDTVRNNPVPAALAGVGLVWLLMNRSKSSKGRSESGTASARSGSSGAGHVIDQVKGAVSGAGSAVAGVSHQISDATGRGLHQAVDAAGIAVHGLSDGAVALAHSAGDTASHLVDQASDAASSVAQGAKRGAKSVEEGFRTQLHENPLALGAAALAIGAVVGLSLPRTQREDTLMGETRDRLLRDAGDAAHEAATSAGHLAEQALEGVKKVGTESSASAAT